MWKRMLKISEKDSMNKINSLTILEVILLLDLIAYSVNLIPYTPTSPLSPAHWRYAGTKVSLTLPEPDPSAPGIESFVKLENTLSKYRSIIAEERKFLLYGAENRYKETLLKNGSKFSKTDISARIGDVVLFDPDNKIGVIESFASKDKDSESTASIRTNKGVVKRAVVSLHPLYHFRVQTRDPKREDKTADYHHHSCGTFSVFTKIDK